MESNKFDQLKRSFSNTSEYFQKVKQSVDNDKEYIIICNELLNNGYNINPEYIFKSIDISTFDNFVSTKFIIDDVEDINNITIILIKNVHHYYSLDDLLKFIDTIKYKYHTYPQVLVTIINKIDNYKLFKKVFKFIFLENDDIQHDYIIHIDINKLDSALLNSISKHDIHEITRNLIEEHICINDYDDKVLSKNVIIHIINTYSDKSAFDFLLPLNKDYDIGKLLIKYTDILKYNSCNNKYIFQIKTEKLYDILETKIHFLEMFINSGIEFQQSDVFMNKIYDNFISNTPYSYNQNFDDVPVAIKTKLKSLINRLLKDEQIIMDIIDYHPNGIKFNQLKESLYKKAIQTS